MESALGWLQSIFDTLLKLFPRLLIVRATHGGVKFVRGSKVVELKPGLHLYWPIVTEIETYCTVRQVIDLPTYTLTSKDGQSLIVSGVVVYEIIDIVTAMVSNYDIWTSIDNLSSISLRNVITNHTYDEIMQNNVYIDKQFTTLARQRLKEFGIKVIFARITDLSKCKVINLVSPGAANAVKAGLHSGTTNA